MDSAPPPGFVIFVVVLLLQLAMRALRDYEATQLYLEQESAKHLGGVDPGDASYTCVPEGSGQLRGVLKRADDIAR